MNYDILTIDMKPMVHVELTKKGYPAVWENGGGLSNTGHSLCVADSEGKRKTALFVRTGGHLACSNHALFILNKGDYLCKVWRQRSDYGIYVYRVLDSKPIEHHNYHDDKFLSIELCHEYSKGEWDVDPEEFLHPLIQAAKDKTCDYHCRSMIYGIVKTNNI